MDTIMHVERHNQLGNPLNELFASQTQKSLVLSHDTTWMRKKNNKNLAGAFLSFTRDIDDDDQIEP